MAAFVSTDITVALAQRDIIPLGMSKKMTFPSITFGDGAITYHDTTKVPMPAIGNFGFRKAIERVFIEQPASGYIYHFDRTNHRIRIFLGAAVAISVANHVGVAPTGNIANTSNVSAGTPAGNVANTSNVSGGTPAGNLTDLAAGAFTGDALAPGTPTGNLSNLAPAAHSHDLVIAANAGNVVDFVGLTAANEIAANANGPFTIAGGNATTGGIANTTPANGAGVFTGDALANITPAGNVANGTGNFTGDALAAHLHTSGAFTGDALVAHLHTSGVFTGDAPANFTHTVTGNTAEAPLAEMDTGVAPAAVTLYTQMIGQ